MQIGHSRATLVAAAALGAACALLPALSVWGFTVDDALIPVRYARHLSEGQGYRFDIGGPPTDGVTPLPWAFVLAPLARAGTGAGAPLDALFRAKLVGLFAWAAAAAAMGVETWRASASRVAKAAAFVGLAALFPVAAYAVSGMETPIATALATVAALLVARGRVRTASAVAGACAAFRPEMAAWAMALALAAALMESDASRRPARALQSTALAIVPFAACAVVRVAVFGRAAPLSLLAKPSDLAHGALYAIPAVAASVAPLLVLLAPVALFRARGPALVLTIAAAVHFAAVALAGGDWMPYYRLVVPVAPALVYATVLFAPSSRTWAILVRAALVALVGGALYVASAPAARRVGGDRASLVAVARPLLAGAHRVAAVDVGWLSAAVDDDVDIVDLAGVTDPTIAVLPGGHTSKAIRGALLLERAPDAILLYLTVRPEPLEAYARGIYPRTVEFNLARDPLVAAHYTPRAWLPLGPTGAGYVLLQRGN